MHVETPRDQRLTRGRAGAHPAAPGARRAARRPGGHAERRRARPRRSSRTRASATSADHHGQARRPRWRERLGAPCSTRWSAAAAASSVLAITGAEDDAGAAAPGAAPSPGRPRASTPGRGDRRRCPPCSALLVRRAGVPVLAHRRRHALSAGGRGRLGALPPRSRGRRLAGGHRRRSTSSSCRPFYTFSVSDVRYVLTFGVMLVVALVWATSPAGSATRPRRPREREQRTSALYGLEPRTGGGPGSDAVLAAALRSLRDTFALEAARPASGRGRRGSGRRSRRPPARRARAGRGPVELRAPQAAGRGTDDPAGQRGAVRAAGVVGRGAVGVLGLRCRTRPTSATPRGAGCSSASRARPRVAIERRRWRSGRRARGRGRGRAAPDSLLSSVSHDCARRSPRSRRGQHAAAGPSRAWPTRTARSRDHHPGGIRADGSAGRQPARHDPAGGRRAAGAEGVALARRGGWRGAAPHG